MSDERRVRLVLEGTVTSYFYPSVQPREALNCFSRHGFERLSITLCKNRCRKAGEAACLGLAASSLAGCFFQGACGALVVGCGVATCCALGGTAAGWTRLDAGDLVGTLPFGRSAAGFVRALRAWFLAGRHRFAVFSLPPMAPPRSGAGGGPQFLRPKQLRRPVRTPLANLGSEPSRAAAPGRRGERLARA